MVETIVVGICDEEAEVMGLEVTNTVIWLGGIELDETGSCKTGWTLVTDLGVGLGLRAELAGFRVGVELEAVLTAKGGLL